VDPVDAAVTVGRRLGLEVGEPVRLRSTNNRVVWLRPSPVVAKVSREKTVAARELVFGHTLAERGAPIVPPAEEFGAQLHEVGEWFLTLWRYVPQDDVTLAPSKQIAAALHSLHLALATLAATASLPTYDVQLRDAIRALEDAQFAPTLVDHDRALLRETLGATLVDLQRASTHVIHGSPHTMNIVMDAGQPRFIDLETIQRGPVEWDLAHLSPEVAVHYPAPYDDDILATARVAVSATTATWCWDALHRGPDMRSHAEHHLAQVRLAQR
jgi:Ser/Thr protein kinase RdoA (MazF antagonist)